MAELLPLDFEHLPNIGIAAGMAGFLGALALHEYGASTICAGLGFASFGQAVCRQKQQIIVHDDLGRVVGTGHVHQWQPRPWGLAFTALGLVVIAVGLWKLLH